MEVYINGFEEFLKQKQVSVNTVCAYISDIKAFLRYLNDQKIALETLSSDTVYAYLASVDHYAYSTKLRIVASLKCFSQYLVSKHVIDQDIAAQIKLVRSEQTISLVNEQPAALTQEQLELLLAQPDTKKFKGIRDKAMLELLYATGIRVSELIGLNVGDVNLQTCVLSMTSERGGRVVPINQTAVGALRRYVSIVKDITILPQKQQPLFTNLNGKRLTRQGFWKIIKTYSEMAGNNVQITPQTLRQTVAEHIKQQGHTIQPCVQQA